MKHFHILSTDTGDLFLFAFGFGPSHDSSHGLAIGARKRALFLASLAELAHEPLSERDIERRAYHLRVHAEIDEPRDRARGRVGVERRENEVAGECGVDGDLRRLAVADLSHHHDVWVLPQVASKAF